MVNQVVTGSDKKSYKVSDAAYGQLMKQTGVNEQGKPILQPASVRRTDLLVIFFCSSVWSREKIRYGHERYCKLY